ncbi:25765_t:CDS:2, partial [Racocetra persica]
CYVYKTAIAYPLQGISCIPSRYLSILKKGVDDVITRPILEIGLEMFRIATFTPLKNVPNNVDETIPGRMEAT